MGRTGNRILAMMFVIIILLFGSTTLIKARRAIVDNVSDGDYAEIPSEIEASITENFKSRNSWININGLFQRLIGTTVIRDAGDIDVFKMSNGQLTYDYPNCNMDQAAEETASLSDYVKQQGAKFVYVQLPCKAYTDELMPIGTHTYGYADSDELISELKKHDVEVLDLRDEIKKDDLNISELFFKTDHHWKPSSAIWAADKIAGRLSEDMEDYTFDPSIYEASNYAHKTYKDWFLGSLGRRTGTLYAGVEDIDIITPKFDTYFQVYTESQTDGKSKNKEGEFSEALLKMSNIKKKDYFSSLTYFTYLGNEYRLCKIENKKAPNDMNILLLRESFSATLLPYLSMSAKEITAIDLRYHKEINIKEHIAENDYDVVVVAYNPSMFREEEAFAFDR